MAQGGATPQIDRSEHCDQHDIRRHHHRATALGSAVISSHHPQHTINVGRSLTSVRRTGGSSRWRCLQVERAGRSLTPPIPSEAHLETLSTVFAAAGMPEVIDAPAPSSKTGSEPSIKRERSRPAVDMRRAPEVDPATTNPTAG